MRLKTNHLCYLVLSAFALLVFSRSFFDPLLWWDDRQHICQNQFLNPLTWNGIRQLWVQPYWGLYAPLAYSLWALPLSLAHWVWGTDLNCLEYGPVFHVLNFILHGANTILVFHLLRALQRDKNLWISLAGALLFAIHPLQVESVAWVSAERDLLSAFFGLWGLLFFLKGRAFGTWVSFALSCFAKATGVIFPLLALSLIGFTSKETRRIQILKLVPSFLFSVGIALLAKYLQPDPALHFELPLWQRPLVALQAFGFYFWKLLIPIDLAPDYGRSVVALQQNSNLYMTALFLMIPVGLLFWKNDLKASLLWMLLALFPSLGFVTFGFQEVSTVADRYFYVAMVGASWAFIQFLNSKNAAGATALVSLLGILSFRQVGYWQNDETLFQHNIEVTPQSSLAHNNLANSYFHRSEYFIAEKEYRKSIELDRSNGSAWLGLARTLEKTNRSAEAATIYQSSIQEKTAVAETYNNFAVYLYQNKDLKEAEESWKTAAMMNSQYLEPRYNLGVLYSEQNRKQEAQALFQEALKLSPNHPQILEKLRQLDIH